jgi:hypothetical protein
MRCQDCGYELTFGLPHGCLELIYHATEKGILDQPSSLTLRDQFAMAALTGILASNPKGAIYEDIDGAITRTAYQLADAMLKVRVRK